ncbi:thiolase family protein [Arthrobacter sp. AZCC_0090]|uniref:thiolase family protein n=1 Tax=Arthrobacter sp. AZCC_0090 TaxID=2735881 RepID=UPI0016082BCC|nr:thiolase family protein [Arthrobacter sp. AZCC_0090]MBB6406320.1 acetyl-CoA C-acetyltransferase [Arthrobacter sp. AZCC_0090]
MSNPVIVGAARTAVGTANKGTLANTPAEELAVSVLKETVHRSGLDPQRFDDVIFAESMYGGGVLARHAAVAANMLSVPGQALNRHCAGSLTAIGAAAASIKSGMENAIIAGGVQSSSLSPKLRQRVPGTTNHFQDPWMPVTHPFRENAPADDMSISVGWNTAQHVGLSRSQMDEWAFRSHQRAIEAIDAGYFEDEIFAITVKNGRGELVQFSVDEHPRRGSSLEKLASLRPIHPEIEGFSITAGNASGVNDAAAAVAVTSAELARDEGLTPLATIRAWTAVGVDPALMGMGGVLAIPRVLAKAGLEVKDVDVWEINEAFAAVPLAACKELGIDDAIVNIHGSGCSIGHPVAASGARMVNTLIRDLQRRGGGIAVASMCAGGGMGGALVIEV